MTNLNLQDYKTLLLSLKDCSRKLTPFIHEGSTGIIFNEKNNYSNELCSWIERCLFHGIKINEFGGIIPFWGLLERLETSLPPIQSIRNSVGAVACANLLRTPIGKARGWIRQALNSQTLDVMIASIVKQPQKLLHLFYHPYALINQPNETNVLVAILRSLKVFQFNFTVDSSILNTCPDWLQLMIENDNTAIRQRNQPPSRRNSEKRTSDTASSPPTSSLLSVDGLFSTFEKGLDLVFNTMENVTTQTVKYLNENSYDEPMVTASSRSNTIPPSPSAPRRISSGSGNIRLALNSNRPLPPLFGTSLKTLLLDERRCAFTFLDYRIGVPNQIKLLIDALMKNLEVPGLFRHRATVNQIENLRRSLEEERGIPPDTTIHTIAQCFLQWCYELPEPLLGYELYSPIQSCQEIEIEADRFRNISLLLDAVPWWNQPILHYVMKLLHNVTRPEVMVTNNLNIVAVSIFATPFLLRSSHIGPISGRGMTIDEIDRLHMIAAASGSVITQILIENQPLIFQFITKQQEDLLTALTIKCDRLREIQIEALNYLITHQSLNNNRTNSNSNNNNNNNNVDKLKHEVQIETEIYSESDKLNENSKINNISDNDNNNNNNNNNTDDDDDDYGLNEIYDYSDLTITREREIYFAMYTLWEDLRVTHYRLNEYYRLKEIEDNNTNNQKKDDNNNDNNDNSGNDDNNDNNNSISPSTPMSPTTRAIRGIEIESASQLDDISDERDEINQNREHNEQLTEWENSMPATTSRLTRLMKSKRWEVCFPVENALREFNSQPGGMLAIKCLSLFIKRFGDKASLIICEFAIKRRHLCSLPMVCVYLIQICLVGLKLVSPQLFTQIMTSKHPSHEVIEHVKIRTVAREACWTLLSDETCLEQLFSISLLTFDDLWKHMLPTGSNDNTNININNTSSSSSSTSPSLITTNEGNNTRSNWLKFNSSLSLKEKQVEMSKDILAACMTGCRVLIDELLYVNNVTHVEQIWKLWTEQRLLRQQIVVEAQLNHTKQLNIEKELHIKQIQQNELNSQNETETLKLIEKENKLKYTCRISTTSDPSTLLKELTGVQSRVIGNRDHMILTFEEMEILEENLPINLQCCNWNLKYSLTRDGASLNTLIRMTSGYKRTLLVIEDSNDYHFGIIISDDSWRINGDKYYGSGTCRLFSFHNPSSTSSKELRKTFHLYETTLKNNYYMFTSINSIGIGGGGGGFALLLDSDLNYGVSNSDCETFDSKTLSKTTEFVCKRCNLFVIACLDGSEDRDNDSRKFNNSKKLYQIDVNDMGL